MSIDNLPIVLMTIGPVAFAVVLGTALWFAHRATIKGPDRTSYLFPRPEEKN